MKPSCFARPLICQLPAELPANAAKPSQDCAAATCPNDGLITFEKFLARIIQAPLQPRRRAALTLALSRGATLHSFRFRPNHETRHRRLMRNSVRALKAMVAVAVALILAAAPAAHANPLDDIVIAHRAGAASRYGEGTLASYKHSVANHADILDGDIHWTKDSPNDSDKLGSILVIHDSTLDRITNCSGKVSSWLWTSIRDKCRTDVGKQPLIRLKTLIAYGDSVGKQVAIGLKNSTITDAQAKQLWNTIKYSNVQLEAPSSRLAGALNKVKKLDAADPNHKIKYALVSTGADGWPSVSKVKSVGTYFHAGLSISSSRMRTYKNAGIKVFLFTGKNVDDYERMAALDPYGVVVDDVAKFQAWRETQT